MIYTTIDREDYDEPRCVICDPQTGLPAQDMRSVPIQRIAEKMDEYCARKDFPAAERHLKYWLEEARFIGDRRGEFSLRNEMMGYYRKQGKQAEAIENAQAALKVMSEIGMEHSVSGGTCYVNVGTVYDSFAQPEEALKYFTLARDVFEENSFKDYFKLAGLYNNMALALVDLERYDEAIGLYNEALDTMKKVDGGELEIAITYLNLADAAAYSKGLDSAEDEIRDYLEHAKACLDTESLPRDGYYAFVCEKCAPGFNCYGFFEYGNEIAKRAEDIYSSYREGDL